jgi:molybdopterin/thiamine biosynthesis adenylyltransferase/rhodanese-related sulfurtransferase
VSAESFDRYERQLVLKGFGNAAQIKLQQAKVLVIGAGGLGCPALQYIAAAGVGTIGIVDHDSVSLHNLHRQILYSTNDIGKNKAETARVHLQALNPEITIHSYVVKLVRSNVIKLISGYDFILDCTDNFDARYLINDACVLLKKPLIFAAVSDYQGQLAIFNMQDEFGVAVNYRDLFPVPPKTGEVPNCEENGVLGVLPGIIGTMQAAELIKLITNLKGALINKLLTYDLLTQQIYHIDISNAEPDSYHMPSMMDFENSEQGDAAVAEIEVAAFKLLIEDGNTCIIDVRELHESPRLNGFNYQQIPMSILEEDSLNGIPETNVVFVCQHGIRSLHAAELFHDQSELNKRFYSLKGGVARWKVALKESELIL